MGDCREFYDRVKKHPDAIVMDVGEPHPFIIHEAHAVVTFKDGTQGHRVVYTTFEYAKKHLKKFKACPCPSCQDVVASYRVNKETMRALQRGEEIEALIPDGWVRDYDH